jgi:hypothetical protein
MDGDKPQVHISALRFRPAWPITFGMLAKVCSAARSARVPAARRTTADVNGIVRRVLRLPCLLALAGLLLWAGCSDSSSSQDIKPKGAHLSRKQALSIAKDAASSHGADLTQFSAPTTRFESSGEKSWDVLFEGRGSGRSHDLLVIVNDQTEQARCFDQ